MEGRVRQNYTGVIRLSTVNEKYGKPIRHLQFSKRMKYEQKEYRIQNTESPLPVRFVHFNIGTRFLPPGGPGKIMPGIPSVYSALDVDGVSVCEVDRVMNSIVEFF